MQQQLPPPGRLMILAIAVRVLANVRVQQPSLVAGHLGEAVLQLNSAVLGRLNFGPGERKTGFKPLQQMVVVAGVTIIAQDFDLWLHCGQFLYSTLGKYAASIVYVAHYGPAQVHSTTRRKLTIR